jgi:hypothetical protein
MVVAVAGHVSGVLALIVPAPDLAGIAVLAMAACSTMWYLRERATQANLDGPTGSR